MKLYADYVKERENKETILDKNGFATYTFLNAEVCYIVDIYVKPENRNKGLAKDLADKIKQIAVSKGAKKLVGSVDIKANGATESMKVLLAYGMSPMEIGGSLIYFVKSI